MYFLELFSYTGLLYLFFLSFFIPPGYLLARCVLKLETTDCFLSSFAFSSLIYALLIASSLFLGLKGQALQVLLISVFATSLYLFFYQKHYRIFFEKDLSFLLEFVFFYLLLTLAFVSFPENSLGSISLSKTMNLSYLPIDNLIPYNLSRYVLESHDPNTLDIVPAWQVSNRGPLAGLLNTAVFSFLGLQETKLWLWSSPGLAFVYQALLSFLNLLSLFVVFFISKHFYGRRAALYSVLALSSSYFYFLNTFFTWPKFFSAYFSLLALSFFFLSTRTKTSLALSGAFLAGAYLAHDLSVFLSAGFFVYAFLSIFCKKLSFREFFLIFLYFLLVYFPWFYFKTFISPGSPRGVYLFAFCYTGQDVSASFSQMFAQYFSEQGLLGILKIRLANLFYPFDVSRYNEIFSKSPMFALHEFYLLSFFSLIGAFGLLYAGFFVSALKSSARTYLAMLMLGLSSLFFAALVAGCAGGTMNHQWCYALYLLLFVPLGKKLAAKKGVARTLSLFAILSNFFWLFALSYLPKKIFFYSTPSFLIPQALIVFALFFLTYKELLSCEKT